MDSLLDNKIELLASALANRLGTILTPKTTSADQPDSTGSSTVIHPNLPTANTNGTSPVKLTEQWDWVEESVLTTILQSSFDPANLHKLTPPEDTILFNLNLEATNFSGFALQSDGTIRAVSATAKLDKTLPTFSHWLSAFTVYASIRSAYDNTGTVASALFHFVREMSHYHLNFPWTQVLRYFYETFRHYQDKPAQCWREPYYKAYAKYMHHYTVTTVATTSGNSNTSNRRKSSAPKGSGTKEKK